MDNIIKERELFPINIEGITGKNFTDLPDYDIEQHLRLVGGDHTKLESVYGHTGTIVVYNFKGGE
jgi:hypothetical protein